MASLQHPFQRLQYASRNVNGLFDVLIATAGRHIYSYNATNGQRLDVWPRDIDSTAELASGATATTEDQTPPEKRRKLSADIESRQEKQCSDGKAPAWTVVPLIIISSDGKYVIATTAEDKTLRVFELSEDGKLKELSSRVMPKKASALALSSDNQTIICGDKFGDVYSMPLIPGEYVKKAVEKPTGPAATALTVHTKGNLRTLEMQKQQAELNAKSAPQENAVLNFEHHNIIGHVSVLTDLITVSASGREYILTADRDEHIRVSRGIPQAHVIEQFLLGHTSLVSKLCIPDRASHLLISGDLDGNLFVWDWKQGKILQHISLQEELQSEAMIRGIWNISLDQANVILINLEGSAQLLCYTIDENGLRRQSTIELPGNVLDLVSIKSKNSVIVSFDTVREAGSIDSWKPSSADLLKTLQIHGQDSVQCTPAEDSAVANINLAGTSDIPQGLNEKQKKEINNSLYNFENMRKKSYDD